MQRRRQGVGQVGKGGAEPRQVTSKEGARPQGEEGSSYTAWTQRAVWGRAPSRGRDPAINAHVSLCLMELPPKEHLKCHSEPGTPILLLAVRTLLLLLSSVSFWHLNLLVPPSLSLYLTLSLSRLPPPLPLSLSCLSLAVFCLLLSPFLCLCLSLFGNDYRKEC